MSEISTPAPGAAPLSAGAPWPFPRRLAAVFTSPRALFEHLADRPSWLVPFLVLLGAILIVFVVLMDPVIVPEQLARMEETGRASEQAVAMMQGPFKWSILVFGMGAIVISMFLYALAVWVIGAFVLGGKMGYRHALSILSHASLVLVPGALLGIPLAFVTKKATVSFGPGAFFPMDQAEGFGGHFLSFFTLGIDVFRLWQTALIALGVGVVARLSPPGKAAIPIWVMFLLVTAIGACIQAALVGMGGG